MTSAEGSLEPYGRIFNKSKRGRFPPTGHFGHDLFTSKRMVGSSLNALLRHAAITAQPLLVNVTRLLCTETLIYEAQKAGGEKLWSRRHCIHSSLPLLFHPRLCFHSIDASAHPFTPFTFTPSNNTKSTIMDGQPRDHIVQVPDWFITLRYVQIGLAALVLALSAFGLSAIVVLGGASYAIFVVSRDS
jgi:hypothetical protein